MASGTDERKARLFAFIQQTTKRAQAAGVVERMKAGRTVSEKTAKTYERNARARLDLSSDGGGRLLEGVSGRSFHAIRAALLHEAARLYGEARKAADEANRAGDHAGQVEAAKKARRAVEAFEAVSTAKKPPTETPKNTKRKTVPRAEDWQARLYEAATPAQKPAVAVLWAVGCRPAELEMGVDIRRGKKGVILVEVPGAKVSEVSGQPRRTIGIKEETPQGQALAALLEADQKSATVKRRAVRIRQDFQDLREKTGLQNVSAYTFRHAFAADMKAKFGHSGPGAEKVAEAMGHRVTKSQKHYGNAKQSKDGGKSVVGVHAVRPVKETRPPGLTKGQPSMRAAKFVKGPDPSGPAGP